MNTALWEVALASPAAEGGLRLLLHHRTMLVTLDTVRAVFGWDAEGVWEQVEGGRLRWVWDISTRPRSGASPAGVRELRFWVCELVAPEFCRALEPAQTVALMLGAQRQCWRACEVAQGLMCSRSIVKRLVDAGELAGPLQQHTRWITRPSLTSFLLRRLAG